MKIIKLESENIKRIQAVEIKPDGSLIIIGGNNGAGKSSVLDSIQYALGGGDSIPSQPIRKGEKKATVVVDLGDLKVTRVFTEKGTRLVVANKDGSVHPTPQSILDDLTGRLSFDPLEFARMKSDRQALTLKNLVGLDLSSLDEKRDGFYANRTEINREVKALEGRIEAMPEYDNVSDKEISVSELGDELERRMTTNQANAEERAMCDVRAGNVSETMERIKGIQEQIAQLERTLTVKMRDLEIQQNEYAKAQKRINTLVDLDVNEIKKNISEAETVNAKIRSNRQLSELTIQHAGKLAKVAALNENIKRVDGSKADLLASAKFPVDGLAFDEHGVTYNGLPFDQASSAEQLRVSVAMGIAMNPKLKILLIRDGSLLDKANLSLIAQMAQDADSQVWLERVGEGKEVSVIIEDGTVKEQEKDIPL